MKAVAVFPSKRDIRLIAHPSPLISRTTEVRLRMLEVGICGTDKEISAFQYGVPPTGSDYLVIGHESLAEVVEVGSEVSRVKVGDLVVPMVRRPCGHQECLACRSGRQDFCFTGDFTERGIKQVHGFMTEYVVDDEQYINLVPHELRDIAVLVEPLTIAEKAMTQVLDVQRRLPWAGAAEPGAAPAHRHTALVLGAGPVGLLGALTLTRRGFNTYVYSRESATSAKASIVRSVGAQYLSAEEHQVEQIPRRVGNIDLVYEAVGASRLAFEVMKILGTNAIFVFTGVPGRKAPIELDTDLIMRNLVLKNQVVFGTVNASRAAFEAAICDLQDFGRRWPTAVRSLITGRYPIEAHADLLQGRAGGIKNVLTMTT
ncbi:MAG: glucose 1-dehydrogenase [Candidatus Binatia bacterium]